MDFMKDVLIDFFLFLGFSSPLLVKKYYFMKLYKNEEQ